MDAGLFVYAKHSPAVDPDRDWDKVCSAANARFMNTCVHLRRRTLCIRPSDYVNSHPDLQWLRLRDDSQEPVRHRAVQQIDLVPTLSLLLGSPIPFGNLGAAIPEMFYVAADGQVADSGDDVERANARFPSLNNALRLNALQVCVWFP